MARGSLKMIGLHQLHDKYKNNRYYLNTTESYVIHGLISDLDTININVRTRSIKKTIGLCVTLYFLSLFYDGILFWVTSLGLFISLMIFRRYMRRRVVDRADLVEYTLDEYCNLLSGEYPISHVRLEVDPDDIRRQYANLQASGFLCENIELPENTSMKDTGIYVGLFVQKLCLLKLVQSAIK